MKSSATTPVDDSPSHLSFSHDESVSLGLPWQRERDSNPRKTLLPSTVFKF